MHLRPNSFVMPALVLAVAQAHALDPSALERCVAMQDAALRLDCYDRAAGRGAGAADAPSPAPAADAAIATTSGAPAPAREAGTPNARSLIGERWALDPASSDGLFGLLPHRESYLLVARHTNRVNNEPFSPFLARTDGLGLDDVESKFQVSFKYKLMQSADRRYALWAGYTQQSHWQVYNDGISRPFRETNYEPELMFAIRPDLDLLGMKWRLANLGLVHQSNGRSEPLSRSWNRIYAQAGLERGDLALFGRVWYRIRESADKDDNPDIRRYLGHGDVEAVWRLGGHTLSALGRYNASSDKGAVQLGWSFPLFGSAKGYLQYFSGYGESLIDYNFHQQAIGIGVMLFDRL
jgi:phospholipase A1